MPTEWDPPVYENDPDYAEIVDGQLVQGVRAAYSPRMIEQMRRGYLCINCDEPTPTAFPVQCALCGFPMRDYQAQEFATRYAGVREFKSQVDWDDERERLERQRDERLRREGLKTKGIWVPSNN